LSLLADKFWGALLLPFWQHFSYDCRKMAAAQACPYFFQFSMTALAAVLTAAFLRDTVFRHYGSNFCPASDCMASALAGAFD
jgi:hypothetical protein